MSKLTIAETLERAADLIEPEGAWTQGEYALGLGGDTLVNGNDDCAVCWCVEGAFDKVLDDCEGYHSPAADFLRRHLGQTVPSWNDALERTQAEVVAKLREAAAKARAEGC